MAALGTGFEERAARATWRVRAGEGRLLVALGRGFRAVVGAGAAENGVGEAEPANVDGTDQVDELHLTCTLGRRFTAVARAEEIEILRPAVVGGWWGCRLRIGAGGWVNGGRSREDGGGGEAAAAQREQGGNLPLDPFQGMLASLRRSWSSLRGRRNLGKRFAREVKTKGGGGADEDLQEERLTKNQKK